jgi:hypothetical protein
VRLEQPGKPQHQEAVAFEPLQHSVLYIIEQAELDLEPPALPEPPLPFDETHDTVIVSIDDCTGQQHRVVNVVQG